MLQLAETKADFRCAGGPEQPGIGTALGGMHRAAEEPEPSLYSHGVPASGTGYHERSVGDPIPSQLWPTLPPIKAPAQKISQLVFPGFELLTNIQNWNEKLKTLGSRVSSGTPSWLLATIADIKFRFFYFCFKPERQQ